MTFTANEIDLLVRGLFALQALQPTEHQELQELLNKFNNVIWQCNI